MHDHYKHAFTYFYLRVRGLSCERCHRDVNHSFQQSKIIVNTVVMWRFARLLTNLDNLSQDNCYVRMTDNSGFLTINGHCDNLLNKKACYMFGIRMTHSSV